MFESPRLEHRRTTVTRQLALAAGSLVAFWRRHIDLLVVASALC